MLTDPAPIPVSVRTRLAAANDRLTQRASFPRSAPAATAASYASLTWPRILRLAEHHRVQARRDAEDVPHGLVAADVVEICGQLGVVRETTVARELFADCLQRGVDAVVRSERDHFDPVARGDEHHFGELASRAQAGEDGRQGIGARREPLSHFHRRRSVRKADREDHGAPALATAAAVVASRTR